LRFTKGASLVHCSKSQIGAIVGGVLAALLLIGIVIVAVVYFKRQLARSEERKARINARLAGEDEILVSMLLVDNDTAEPFSRRT